jgi:hypothetical protein
MRCQSEQDVEEIRKLAEKECKQYEVSKPKTRNPLIAVYGIETDIKDKDIIEEIIEKNKDIEDFLKANSFDSTEEHIKLKIRLKSKTGRNGQTLTQ